MYNQILKFLESNDLLSENQLHFRKNYSASNAVMCYVQESLESEKNKMFAEVFMISQKPLIL